jgi:hypothetical protein
MIPMTAAILWSWQNQEEEEQRRASIDVSTNLVYPKYNPIAVQPVVFGISLYTLERTKNVIHTSKGTRRIQTRSACGEIPSMHCKENEESKSRAKMDKMPWSLSRIGVHGTGVIPNKYKSCKYSKPIHRMALQHDGR